MWNLGFPGTPEPPEEPAAPAAAKIDERFFMEWVDLGLEAIAVRLRRQREFEAWCLDHPQPTTQEEQ